MNLHIYVFCNLYLYYIHPFVLRLSFQILYITHHIGFLLSTQHVLLSTIQPREPATHPVLCLHGGISTVEEFRGRIGSTARVGGWINELGKHHGDYSGWFL